MSDLERNFTIWFDPKKGGIRLAKPYNGKRHNDLRQTVTMCNGLITLSQFEDGEFESMELFVAGAGLTIDVWPGVKPKP